eukprot:6260963-Prymnesium_polylepis.1
MADDAGGEEATATGERDLSGDGGVTATHEALKTSVSETRPKDLSTVVVDFWVRSLADSPEPSAASLLGSREAFEFRVDSGTEQCAGLDWAVKDMQEGQQRKFSMTAAYAPLADGYAPLAGGSTDSEQQLEVEVKLVKLTQAPDVWSSNNAGKIKFAEEMRVDGNRWFTTGAYSRADRRYSSAINAVAMDQDYTREEKEAVKKLGLMW